MGSLQMCGVDAILDIASKSTDMIWVTVTWNIVSLHLCYFNCSTMSCEFLKQCQTGGISPLKTCYPTNIISLVWVSVEGFSGSWSVSEAFPSCQE